MVLEFTMRDKSDNQRKKSVSIDELMSRARAYSIANPPTRTDRCPSVSDLKLYSQGLKRRSDGLKLEEPTLSIMGNYNSHIICCSYCVRQVILTREG